MDKKKAPREECIIRIKPFFRAIRYYFKHNFKYDVKYTLSKQKTMTCKHFKLSEMDDIGSEIEIPIPKLPMSAIANIWLYYKIFSGTWVAR